MVSTPCCLRAIVKVSLVASVTYARRGSLSFGRESGEIERTSSSSVHYHGQGTGRQQQETVAVTTTPGLLFEEEGGDVTTPIPISTTLKPPTRAPRRGSAVLSFGSEEGVKEETSSQSEHQSGQQEAASTTTVAPTTTTAAPSGVNFEEEEGDVEERLNSSQETFQPVVVPDNSTTGVNKPACHSDPQSIRVYDSRSGAPIPISDEHADAPYKLDIILSTLYFGPAPSDLLLTAILKDGNIVEFRFKDRRAMRCFLVFIFEKKTVGEDKQDHGLPEEEGDEDVEEVPISRNSNAVNPNFSEEEGIVEEKEDEEIFEATTGKLPEEVTTPARPTTSTMPSTTTTTQRPSPATTTAGLVFGEDDGHVEPREEGSRLSFGVEEGEAVDTQQQQQSNEVATPPPPTTTTTAVTNTTSTTTSTTTTPTASENIITFGEHQGEVTTTSAPSNGLAFGSEEGSAEEVAESDLVEVRPSTTTTTTTTPGSTTESPRTTTQGITFGESDGEVEETTEGPVRVLFGEEDGEAARKEDSKVEVGGGGGGSGKGGGQSDSLSGDSEVADSGETIKRRETTTTTTTTVTATTTPPSTTPAPSSPSLTFDKHEGEEVAEEKESSQAPIPTTSPAPTTPAGTIDFGESAGVITNSPPEESEGRLTFGMEEGEAQHFVESKSNNAVSSTAAPTATAPPAPTTTTTSTTTAATTTTTEAPVGVHFGEASGAVTTSPPEKTAAPLRFDMEEGEAESVAESRLNVAVSSSTAAPSPTTTVAPSTTTTAGVLFGESDGEVEEAGVPETSGPRVKFGEDDGEVEPEGEGVRLGGGTYVTEGGHRVEEGGHEIRDHRTTNKTESTRFHQPEEVPDTTFEEDVGNVRPHESTDVATEEEEGEVAEADVDRPSAPLQFSEHAGMVEAEEDKTAGTLDFAGDDGTVVATAPRQQNVQLGGGTTTQHRAGSVEEGGSFLNSTHSQRTESSSHHAGNTAAGGWRVREVKLVDGHRDLTSKSKAQQLADLSIHGGTYTQNHAGHTMEGGFHINDTMRSHRNESVMVGDGEGPSDQPTASGKPSASSVTNSEDFGGWRVKALDELPDAARQLAYQRPAADGPSAVLVTPSNGSSPSSMSEENDSGSLPSEGLKAAGMRKLHYALSRI
ncbi:hypothetical protein FOZ60_010025 [Perkinsus olseni]|uniref:Uncharacterized protein n=2 Tax=Perkinsus olseni TaxID=32597 RepID=A0A7J6NG98_PEROL|nr:hypothetical protein FOZ60_010025 [Perkinsus olseni]